MLKQLNVKKIQVFLLLIFLMSCLLNIFNTTNYAITSSDIEIKDYTVSFKGGDSLKTSDDFLNKYKGVLVLVGSIATITALMFLIINITKLGGAGNNPTTRQSAVMGIIWSGIAIALLGSVTMWFGYFFYFLKDTK